MIKTLLSMLGLLLAANMTFAANNNLDKNRFNLISVNKGDFMLVKSPISTPTPKQEAPKTPKITEPIKTVPQKTEPKIGEVYKDDKGNWRKKSDDNEEDWHWDGQSWYRTLNLPQKDALPQRQKKLFNRIAPTPPCTPGGT